MRYFPIFVDLENRPVVVTGGGEKAAQKLRLMARTEARLIVVAGKVGDEVQGLAAAGRVSLHRHPAGEADLSGAALVIIADDEAAEVERIAKVVRGLQIAVNVVDRPDLSTFIMPAIVDRDPVTVAIGTEGTSPIIARQIKAHLDQWLPANLGHLARAARDFRARVRARIAEPSARRHLWERLLSGEFRHRVLKGDRAGAERVLDGELRQAANAIPGPGIVSLVGCGPGDPELLTLKAHRTLREADVLVVDRLVDPAVLEHARRDARRIDVGKKAGGPSVSQEEINRILVREALMGHRVARLKGGDAFIFGRAAEEMTAVRAAGIEVEIIPGVTAAHACAASVGLPLTLRRKIRQFSVVTGGVADGDLDLDWGALARPDQAFAVYMGVGTAGVFSSRLIAAGADPATAVVIVENGTLAKERSMQTTLEALPATIREKRVDGPAIILVGLAWEDAHLTRPAKVEVVSGQAAASAPAAVAGEPKEMTPEEVAVALYWTAG